MHFESDSVVVSFIERENVSESTGLEATMIVDKWIYSQAIETLVSKMKFTLLVV